MRHGVPSSRRHFRRLHGFGRLVIRNAGVKRLAAANRVRERAHRFFQRRVGIGPMRIKNIHIRQTHPLERLVERRQQIFARTPFTIRARPHVVARLGRDDQFIAPFAEVFAQDATEGFLRRTTRRAVIVCQVKAGDAQVKRAQRDGPGVLVRILSRQNYARGRAKSAGA